MSETRSYDGPNWRENPDEHAPPVRRSGSVLAAHDYDNPEIASASGICGVTTCAIGWLVGAAVAVCLSDC